MKHLQINPICSPLASKFLSQVGACDQKGNLSGEHSTREWGTFSMPPHAPFKGVPWKNMMVVYRRLIALQYVIKINHLSVTDI